MSAASRIATRFAALKRDGRRGLVAFVTAGDPDPETSLAIVKGLPGAGADVIELGVPFSDPMADGPAIQASSLRAIRSGATVASTLRLVAAFRETDAATPIVLMGYYNPIYGYGVDNFVRDAATAGVDGLIVVDLPPEESDELRLPARTAGLDLIVLVAPTTGHARLPFVLKNASGFVYYVAVTGITGTKSAAAADVGQAVRTLRRATKLPVAVGFGIRTAEQAQAVAGHADAAVVGSALVAKVAENLDADGKAKSGVVPAVLGLVRDLADGAHRAGAAETRGERREGMAG